MRDSMTELHFGEAALGTPVEVLARLSPRHYVPNHPLPRSMLAQKRVVQIFSPRDHTNCCNVIFPTDHCARRPLHSASDSSMCSRLGMPLRTFVILICGVVLGLNSAQHEKTRPQKCVRSNNRGHEYRSGPGLLCLDAARMSMRAR